MISSDADSDFEISGESITDDELLELRRWRGDETYTPAPGVDAVQDRCTDTEICLLGPFLKYKDPPDPTALQAILNNHPVRVARHGCSYERYALDTLVWYCRQKGDSWNTLKNEAEQLLAKVKIRPNWQDGRSAD
jgi:hypothetical protein